MLWSHPESQVQCILPREWRVCRQKRRLADPHQLGRRIRQHHSARCVLENRRRPTVDLRLPQPAAGVCPKHRRRLYGAGHGRSHHQVHCRYAGEALKPLRHESIRQTSFAQFARAGLLCLAGLAADAAVFPGRDWETATPESQGVDAGKLQDAVALLERTVVSMTARVSSSSCAMALIWQGNNIDKVHGVWSFTKVFTSTVLGLLIDDGKCALDTKAKDFVPALAAAYPRPDAAPLHHDDVRLSCDRRRAAAHVHSWSERDTLPAGSAAVVHAAGHAVRLLGLRDE